MNNLKNNEHNKKNLPDQLFETSTLYITWNIFG